MITQSSPCPAPATADEPLEPPELLAVAADELETPLPDLTVTDEPPGMFVDPESPPGPVVTVLEGPHCTTRQSVPALRSRFVLLVAVDCCCRVPLAVTVVELLPAAAHGSFPGCSACAAKAGNAKTESANAPLAASVRKVDEGK